MLKSGQHQHLSDEAVAAFADDVLVGHARQRARHHTAVCPECNHAVAVQREAVWALRAAPAPSLPMGLLDRLREVPVTTPIRSVPTHVDEHGMTMFASFAAPRGVRPRRGLALTPRPFSCARDRLRRGSSARSPQRLRPTARRAPKLRLSIRQCTRPTIWSTPTSLRALVASHLL